MNVTQHSAAASLKAALRRVKAAGLALKVYDGSVWVVPTEVEMWPDGARGNPFDVLAEHGQEVGPTGLSADGGAGA